MHEAVHGVNICSWDPTECSQVGLLSGNQLPKRNKTTNVPFRPFCVLFVSTGKEDKAHSPKNWRVFVCFLFVPIKTLSTCQSWEPLIYHLPVLGALLHSFLKLMQVVVPCFAAGSAVTDGCSTPFFALPPHPRHINCCFSLFHLHVSVLYHFIATSLLWL